MLLPVAATLTSFFLHLKTDSFFSKPLLIKKKPMVWLFSQLYQKNLPNRDFKTEVTLLHPPLSVESAKGEKYLRQRNNSLDLVNSTDSFRTLDLIL